MAMAQVSSRYFKILFRWIIFWLSKKMFIELQECSHCIRLYPKLEVRIPNITARLIKMPKKS
jgi:hypothetical protein